MIKQRKQYNATRSNQPERTMEHIFGHSWEAIQRAQHGGRLSQAVVRDDSLPTLTDAERAIVAQHGSVAALESTGLYGLADRVRRGAK